MRYEEVDVTVAVDVGRDDSLPVPARQSSPASTGSNRSFPAASGPRFRNNRSTERFAAVGAGTAPTAPGTRSSQPSPSKSIQADAGTHRLGQMQGRRSAPASSWKRRSGQPRPPCRTKSEAAVLAGGSDLRPTGGRSRRANEQSGRQPGAASKAHSATVAVGRTHAGAGRRLMTTRGRDACWRTLDWNHGTGLRLPYPELRRSAPWSWASST